LRPGLELPASAGRELAQGADPGGRKNVSLTGNRSAARVVLDAMGQPVWRSRGGAVAISVAALVVGISALFIVLGIRNQKGSDAAILPPIMPTADAPYASSEPSFYIPPAFTAADDAMAVGSQRYRGSESLPGHQRGVVMRQGRTLVTYFDSGQSVIAPTFAEIGAYATVARPVATELASAPWNQ